VKNANAINPRGVPTDGYAWTFATSASGCENV
jgi:hypothetical protein